MLVMQDNAPSHSAKDTINEFRQRHITPIQWPACSPDLDDGKRRSEDELRLIVKEAWDSVTSEQIAGLDKTMPGRCKTVIDANGGYTKY